MTPPSCLLPHGFEQQPSCLAPLRVVKENRSGYNGDRIQGNHYFGGHLPRHKRTSAADPGYVTELHQAAFLITLNCCNKQSKMKMHVLGAVLPPVYAPVLNPITVEYQLIPNNATAAPQSTCTGTGASSSCPNPPDSASPLLTACGCTSLQSLNLTAYHSIQNLNYYQGLSSISGQLILSSDISLQDLSGLQVIVHVADLVLHALRCMSPHMLDMASTCLRCASGKCQNVASITSYLLIATMPAVQSLATAFTNLQSLGSFLAIFYNSALTTLPSSAFPALTTVQQFLYILSNGFVNLDGCFPVR